MQQVDGGSNGAELGSPVLYDHRHEPRRARSGPNATSLAATSDASTASPTSSAAVPKSPKPTLPSAIASAIPPPSASAIASTVPVVASASAAPPQKPVGSRTSGSHFTLDFAAPGDCKSGARCPATLTLHATEGYHINDAYPYKLVANENPNVDFLGKEGRTYSKAGGELVKTGETTARMNLPFQAKSPGKAHISGTFKMSVCSESNCQIESPTVALDVPIDQ